MREQLNIDQEPENLPWKSAPASYRELFFSPEIEDMIEAAVPLL